jgi:hypothetical protein
MADEENVDTEGADAGQGEFVPAKPVKPKSDVYTTMLILAFLAFLTGAIVSGREAWEHYDVQFGMFEKRQGASQGTGTGTTETPVDAATPPTDAATPPTDAPK